MIDMSLSLPDLYLFGALGHDKPIPLKPFVSHFLPANIVPDMFELSKLELGLGLKDPHKYTFDIILANLWSVPIGKTTLEMTRLSVYMEGVGAQSPALSIQGVIKFAETQVYLSAETKAGTTNWLFKGGTQGENNYGNPPPPNTTGVKILALLLPIIALIGIAAAIALPAYQQYVNQAQMQQQ